ASCRTWHGGRRSSRTGPTCASTTRDASRSCRSSSRSQRIGSDTRWYVPSTGSTPPSRTGRRSEEHTSELQSLAYLVCRLLLEKKKKHVMYALHTDVRHADNIATPQSLYHYA